MDPFFQTEEGWWVLRDDPFSSAWIISERRIDHHDVLPGLERVWKYLGDGSVVVDAGAHLGSWTVPMLRAVGHGGTVISYEPDPQIAECLRRNACKEIKDLRRNVKWDFRESCVSDSDANLGFMRNLLNRGGSSICPFPHPYSPTIEYLEVKTEPLDDLLLVHPKIDLIKLDIEGEEFNALKSGSNLINRDHPIMFIEANPDSEYRKARGYTLGIISDWIKEHGYSVIPFPEINPHDFLCLPLF